MFTTRMPDFATDAILRNLPTGAPELLIALATPAPRGFWGIPVLLWGRPGSGKTSFVESLGREDFPVYTLIASLHDPTDFGGFPTVDGDRMRFLPPQWVEVFEKPQQGILFLDEITTAPPAVQAALLRLVLERRMGACALPPAVRVVAAANPPDTTSITWELSPPLANRFVHLSWEIPADLYVRALQEGFLTASLPEVDPLTHEKQKRFWQGLLSGFLRRAPQHLYTSPAPSEYAYATPRSWDFAVALMTTCDLLQMAPGPNRTPTAEANDILFRLIAGAVGSAAARAFVEFVKSLRLPDPEALLDGRVPFPNKLREDEIWVLFSTMSGLLQNTPPEGETLGRRLSNFLEAAVKTIRRGRGDTILPTLRKLIQSGWLSQHTQPEHSSLLKELGQYYEPLLKIERNIDKIERDIDSLSLEDLF